MFRCTLAFASLLVLSSCSKESQTPPAKEATLEKGDSSANSPRIHTDRSLRTMGWSVDSISEDGYKRFQGSGEISGIINADWNPVLSHVEDGAVQLTLQPSNESKRAYPLISDMIDIPSNDRVLLALGLDNTSPVESGICQFNVPGTFIIGDYYRGDMPDTDAYPDTSALIAVVKRERPTSVECEPEP